MKKFYLFLFLAGLFFCTQAQEESDSVQTLFKPKSKKLRPYFGPLLNMTTIDSELAYVGGFTIAGIINEHFVVGLYVLELKNNFASHNANYVGYNIYVENKGLWLGYIFMPEKMIHFTTNVQAGKGNFKAYNRTIDTWLDDNFVFFLTPSIEAELNIARFLKVGIGATYNMAFDVNKLTDYNDSDFTGLGAFASFKFGWFR